MIYTQYVFTSPLTVCHPDRSPARFLFPRAARARDVVEGPLFRFSPPISRSPFSPLLPAPPPRLSSRPKSRAFSLPARSAGAGRSGGTSLPHCLLHRGNSRAETSSLYKSLHLGLLDSINATLFSRRHLLICFSRAIAAPTSPKTSKYTSRFTLYVFVNPGKAFRRCCATRFSSSFVMPV